MQEVKFTKGIWAVEYDNADCASGGCNGMQQAQLSLGSGTVAGLMSQKELCVTHA